MAWHANRPAKVIAVSCMVRCAGCRNAKLRKMKKGDVLRVNDCSRLPLLVFFTDVPRRCRYYKDGTGYNEGKRPRWPGTRFATCRKTRGC